MASKGVLCLVALSCLLFVSNVNGARILGVFPTSGPSHYITGSALMKGLAAKGHEVTVISPFPQKQPLKRYRDVPVVEVLNISMLTTLLNDVDKMNDIGVLEIFDIFFQMGLETCTIVGESKNVKNLLDSKEEHFDLIIMEVFLTESLFGFADHFNAPIIGFSSFGATNWHTDLVGVPSPPSFVPHPMLSFSDDMNFLQRLGNVAYNAVNLLHFNYVFLPQQEILYSKNFPNAKKSLQEIRRNFSLVILNQHFSLSAPRPYTPGMIEAGGMHIKRTVDPLPADMQAFLDAAPEGVIYFSMGSNLKSKNIPTQKLNAILKTFASLKQKVMWKFEDASFPGIPKNVYINSWFPQSDVLAHPNVKLFITHGGLLSTTETIFHGKPIVGIPMFGDQHMNMARAVEAGIGLTVDYKQLDEQGFKATITELLSNPSYTNNAQEISKRYRDQPMTPLDTAIFWVEYVLRHKGARHLQVSGVKLNFWQYHSVDTIAVLVFGILLIFLIVGVAIKSIVWKLFCRKQKLKNH